MKNIFEPLNNYFDKVYVITLERAKERQEKFNKTFNGLNYEFLFGADNANFKKADLIEKNIYNETLAKKHERHSHTMIEGQIGCAWSHKLVYEKIVENNYSRVLICEDDIVPDPANFSLIPKVFNELPADWELLYLGYGKNEKPPPFQFIKKRYYHFLSSLGVLKWNHRIISNLYPRPYSKYLKKAGFHDGTYSYAISANAAKILLKKQTPISFLADNLLAYAITDDLLNAFITCPKLINHEEQVIDGKVFSHIKERR